MNQDEHDKQRAIVVAVALVSLALISLGLLIVQNS